MIWPQNFLQGCLDGHNLAVLQFRLGKTQRQLRRPILWRGVDGNRPYKNSAMWQLRPVFKVDRLI